MRLVLSWQEWWHYQELKGVGKAKFSKTGKCNRRRLCNLGDGIRPHLAGELRWEFLLQYVRPVMDITTFQ
jgi:hypothetical protein